MIRLDSKDSDGTGLNDVLIYDHSKKDGNTHVIRAEKGKMQMSPDERYLIFELTNGSSYEEVEGKNRPHMLSEFDQEIMRFDLSGFQMERSDKELFKDNYQMLNLRQLDMSIDSLNEKRTEKRLEFNKSIENRVVKLVNLDSIRQNVVEDSNMAVAYNELKRSKQVDHIEGAIANLRQSKTNIATKNEIIVGAVRNVNRHKIEWHRKFTLSIACIILFFIGAPLGAIIRKGGLGLPVVISVLFFLAYHITSITFEKLAKQGEMDPGQAMWIASFILLPIGLYLTYQASTDSRVLDMETYTKFIQRLTRFINPKEKVESAN